MTTNPVKDRVKGLCIVSKCTTVDEFVTQFHGKCDDTSIFVSAVVTREIGSESEFAILLADKTPVLRGWCVVFDVFTDAANIYKRPGMRLGLHRLTPKSQATFERIQAVRKATGVMAAAAPTTVEGRSSARVVQRAPTLTIPPIVEVSEPRRATTPSMMEADVDTIVEVSEPRLTTTPSMMEADVDTIVEVSEPRRTTIPSMMVAEVDTVVEVSEPRRTTTPSMMVAEVESNSKRTRRTAAMKVQVPSLRSAAGTVSPVSRMSRVEPLAVPVSRAESSASLAPAAEPQPSEPKRDTPRFITAEGSKEVCVPAVERREPHSADVLPANPLMNLTDASLDAFVECHLIEPSKLPPVSRLPASSGVVEPITDRDELAVDLPPRADGFVPTHTPIARRQIAVAAMIMCALVILIGTIVAVLGADATEPEAVVTVPDVVRAPTIAPRAVAPEQPPAVIDVEKTVGEGPCSLRVVTTPAGASVKLDGRFAGSSPLEIRSPCTKRRVDIASAKYVGQTHWVAPGEVSRSIDVALSRPSVLVLVHSYPSNAKVSLDDRVIGSTPTYVRVPASTPVVLTIERLGFRRTTKQITVESPQRVFVPLSR